MLVVSIVTIDLKCGEKDIRKAVQLFNSLFNVGVRTQVYYIFQFARSQ